MTNKEAIEKLKEIDKGRYCRDCVHPSQVGWCEEHCGYSVAMKMAIEALEAQEKTKDQIIEEYLNGYNDGLIDGIYARKTKVHKSGCNAPAHNNNQTWIPYNILEDLEPLEKGNYLVQYANGQILVDYYDGHYFACAELGDDRLAVVAWMPLPNPFKESQPTRH